MPQEVAFAHTHVEADITDLDHTDTNAIHDNVSGEISAITLKSTPVSADLIIIEDSAASNAKKRVTIGALGVGGGAPMVFGDYSIATSTTVRYIHPMGQDNGSAHTAELQIEVPRAGTFKNLRVLAGTAGTGAATITYTLRKNASDTALLVAMSNTATAGADTSNTVAVVAGDKISISAAKSTGITSSQLHIHISLELAA